MHSSTTTVYDCNLLHLPKIENPAGSITVIEGVKEIPFNIKRIYYLYDVPGGASRGGHAHKHLHQLIIAASGSYDIILDDGKIKRTILLNRPYYGLLMPPGIWRDLSNFSSGAICIVLASDVYKEQDYIRDYDDFLNFKKH
jgi:dTDP-4-dehydrorhamnose 3,5-epimerase-like enzyme